MGGLRTSPSYSRLLPRALGSWGTAWAAGQQPQGAGGRLPQAVFPIVIVGALGASLVVAEL